MDYVRSRQHTQIAQLLPLKKGWYKCLERGCHATGPLSYIKTIPCCSKLVNSYWERFKMTRRWSLEKVSYYNPNPTYRMNVAINGDYILYEDYENLRKAYEDLILQKENKTNGISEERN